MKTILSTILLGVPLAINLQHADARPIAFRSSTVAEVVKCQGAGPAVCEGNVNSDFIGNCSITNAKTMASYSIAQFYGSTTVCSFTSSALPITTVGGRSMASTGFMAVLESGAAQGNLYAVVANAMPAGAGQPPVTSTSVTAVCGTTSISSGSTASAGHDAERVVTPGNRSAEEVGEPLVSVPFEGSTTHMSANLIADGKVSDWPTGLRFEASGIVTASTPVAVTMQGESPSSAGCGIGTPFWEITNITLDGGDDLKPTFYTGLGGCRAAKLTLPAGTHTLTVQMDGDQNNHLYPSFTPTARFFATVE